MRISTVNVNGIRAASRKGFLEWLSSTTSDVVCLQEVRATSEQMPPELAQLDEWQVFLAPAEAKGRAGVAVLTRTTPKAHRVGFNFPQFDESGRYIEVDFPNATVASLYLPSGETGTPRQVEKEQFMDAFLAYMKRAKAKAESEGRSLVVCGDWNIAHKEIDLKNWRNNQKTAGFLPEERAWLTRVFDEVGYVDVLRKLYPEGPGPYSWWSVRGRAFDNDTGWRVDYQVATPDLAARAISAVVERYPSHEARWSDHAPVTMEYNVEL